MAGVGKILCNLVLGPLLIYAVLMSHVMYQSFVRAPMQPAAATAPVWPSTVSAKEKADLISSRKAILEGYCAAASGTGNVREFAAKYFTEDLLFEDPIMNMNSREETADLFVRATSYLKPIPPKIHKEVHGPNEIVADVTFPFVTLGGWDLGPFNITIHLLLTAPGKNGQLEKIKEAREEHHGNPLLDEGTVTPAFIGSIHSKLRLFHGYLITLLI